MPGPKLSRASSVRELPQGSACGSTMEELVTKEAARIAQSVEQGAAP